MQLQFEAADDGSVSAEFACPTVYQGYPQWLHGGITSTVLDGAMANCLFANSIVGATGELSIRFRDSVKIDTPVVVRAWLKTTRPPLFLAEAELSQNGQVIVVATGKFIGRRVNTPPTQGD